MRRYAAIMIEKRGGLLPLILLAACLAALPSASRAAPRSILFIGNSFTFGNKAAVKSFHPERVRDLNGEGASGMPALFKTFADEVGLAYDVSLETSPGKPLSFHLDEKRSVIDGRWDVVVMQGYSTLDRERPGDPTRHLAAARALVRLFRAANPRAKIDLVASWSRADQIYPDAGHWHGQPIEKMADDIAAASKVALTGPDRVDAIVPVGAAWNRAMRDGVADLNPYDGIDPGRIDLWADDHYHASNAGYYLEALVVFGRVTGVDPRKLGSDERAAAELGMPSTLARRLQQIAQAELAATR